MAQGRFIRNILLLFLLVAGLVFALAIFRTESWQPQPNKRKEKPA